MPRVDAKGGGIQSVRASPYCQQDHPYEWLAPSSLSSSWLLALVWVQSKESAFGRLHLPQIIDTHLSPCDITGFKLGPSTQRIGSFQSL